jgi:hypothetical protein
VYSFSVLLCLSLFLSFFLLSPRAYFGLSDPITSYALFYFILRVKSLGRLRNIWRQGALVSLSMVETPVIESTRVLKCGCSQRICWLEVGNT